MNQIVPNEFGTVTETGGSVGTGRASARSVVCLILGLVSVILFFAFLPSAHSIESHSPKTLQRIAVAFVCSMIASGGVAALLGTMVLRNISRQVRPRDMSMARSGRALGVVGCILGGLAVFATHGWMEAELHQKIAQDKASLRTIATALEQYSVYQNVYPPALVCLTRPVPEPEALPTPAEEERRVHGPTRYVTCLNAIPPSQFGDGSVPRYWHPDSTPFSWLVWTPGPDGIYDIATGDDLRRSLEYLGPNNRERPDAWLTDRTYDPTNGTVSAGDLVWWHR